VEKAERIADLEATLAMTRDEFRNYRLINDRRLKAYETILEE
jgi:hypothetical protein